MKGNVVVNKLAYKLIRRSESSPWIITKCLINGCNDRRTLMTKSIEKVCNLQVHWASKTKRKVLRFNDLSLHLYALLTIQHAFCRFPFKCSQYDHKVEFIFYESELKNKITQRVIVRGTRVH